MGSTNVRISRRSIGPAPTRSRSAEQQLEELRRALDASKNGKPDWAVRMRAARQLSAYLRREMGASVVAGVK